MPPSNLPKLSASPSRERLDASMMLNQLMKRVDYARRSRSADLSGSRFAHDEEVRKRREEVLRDSKAAALLRSMREQAEQEEKLHRKAQEEKRKSMVREGMYHEFESKRSSLNGNKDRWKESAAMIHHEEEEFAQMKRKLVKEQKEEAQRQKYAALQYLTKDKEDAHAARLREKKHNEVVITHRAEDRSKQVAVNVAAVKQLTQSKQDALDAVYERNRQARQHILSVNEALRRRELQDIADQMDRLQKELSQLS